MDGPERRRRRSVPPGLTATTTPGARAAGVTRARMPGNQAAHGLLEGRLRLSPQLALRFRGTLGNQATLGLLDEQLRVPEGLATDPIARPLPRLDAELRWFPGLTVEQEFPHVKNIIANARTAEAYAQLVLATFGSFDTYWEAARVADAELDTVIDRRGRTLRSLIELHGPTQTIFYRWVRWEYVKRGLDPLETILRGRSPDMETRIQAAEAALKSNFKTQGFNPRPEKDPRMRYIFGTLSMHATGQAVDIDPDHNLFISQKAWTYVQTAVRMRIDVSLERWKKDPGGVYDDVAALSRRWAELAQQRVASVQRAARMSGSLVGELRQPRLGEAGSWPGTKPSLLGPTPVLGLEPGGSGQVPRTSWERAALDALRDVPGMGDKDKLASIGGFFSLSKDLVLQLRTQGLRWGVTFPNKDLHHFEIPEKPLPRWPAVP
jgi:hypothetical protein